MGIRALLLRIGLAKPRLGEVVPSGVLKRAYDLEADDRELIRINFAEVPVELRDLIPQAERWGIIDDIVRADFIEKQSASDKADLHTAVSGRRSTINTWLDSLGDTAAWPRGAVHFMFMISAYDLIDTERLARCSSCERRALIDVVHEEGWKPHPWLCIECAANAGRLKDWEVRRADLKKDGLL